MKTPMLGEATYYGIHIWLKALYEKLGFMLLAKSHGRIKTIHAYKESILELIKNIEYKLKIIKCEDKLHDLSILKINAEVLKKAASKLL